MTHAESWGPVTNLLKLLPQLPTFGATYSVSNHQYLLVTQGCIHTRTSSTEFLAIFFVCLF